jgi:hypothetical protein
MQSSCNALSPPYMDVRERSRPACLRLSVDTLENQSETASLQLRTF